MAVTMNVITNVPQKYKFQCGIKPNVFATIIINVAETVENPVAMIVASLLLYKPMPHWNLYFWGTLVITFIVTAITAWLPPIVNESTEYYNGQEGEAEVEINDCRFSFII